MRISSVALVLSTLAAALLSGATPAADIEERKPKPPAQACCPDYCIICMGPDPCNPKKEVERYVCGCDVMTTKCKMKPVGPMCTQMVMTCMGHGTVIGGCDLGNKFCLEDCRSTLCFGDRLLLINGICRLLQNAELDCDDGDSLLTS